MERLVTRCALRFGAPSGRVFRGSFAWTVALLLSGGFGLPSSAIRKGIEADYSRPKHVITVHPRGTDSLDEEMSCHPQRELSGIAMRFFPNGTLSCPV